MTDTPWTAPEVERPTGPNVATERAAAETLLDYHRATLLWKCAGLTADQLKMRAVPPSSMSLLGLVRHLADVERVWFRHRLAGEEGLTPLYWQEEHPDGDFDLVDDADAAADFATLDAEVQAARAVQGAHHFDDTFVVRHRDGTEETVDVRTLVLHMVEEYARHNGHADIIREAIDGEVGE